HRARPGAAPPARRRRRARSRREAGRHARLPAPPRRRHPVDVVRAERRAAHPRRRRARPRSRCTPQQRHRQRDHRPRRLRRPGPHGLPAVRHRVLDRIRPARGGTGMTSPDPASTALTPHLWSTANRELVAKMLTEFSYEEIITPDVADDGTLRWDLGTGVLTATATPRAMGWWRVHPDSLRWSAGALPDAADLLSLVLQRAGADASIIAAVIGEVSSTLLSDVVQLSRARAASELVDLDPVLVESELRGHPWIVANKGRVGFGAQDLLAYAPETGPDIRLHWLAADPAIADAVSVDGLGHHDVVREQVGDADLDRLRARAQLGGLDPDTCVYLPVHPWQWSNRIVPLHAVDLARGALAA